MSEWHKIRLEQSDRQQLGANLVGPYLLAFTMLPYICRTAEEVTLPLTLSMTGLLMSHLLLKEDMGWCNIRIAIEARSLQHTSSSCDSLIVEYECNARQESCAK